MTTLSTMATLATFNTHTHLREGMASVDPMLAKAAGSRGAGHLLPLSTLPPATAAEVLVAACRGGLEGAGPSWAPQPTGTRRAPASPSASTRGGRHHHNTLRCHG